MLNYATTKLEDLIIHNVGNKGNDEGLFLSEKPSNKISEQSESILVSYFLSPFKGAQRFHFWHESELELNEIYSYARGMFESRRSFVSKSKNIAKHLYENSEHPKIKAGDLYIAYMNNCVVDEEVVDAIAIFKTESKDVFLQSYKTGEHLEFRHQEGVNINKIDKGCIIFNAKENEGFKVHVIDNTNKSGEAQYWRDHFLKVKPTEDSYHLTQEFMSLTKAYIADELDEQFEVDKTAKIELLNRTSKYFKTHEAYNKADFEKEVIQEPDLIESFRDYKRNFNSERIRSVEEFDISSDAVKRQQKIFKSVLKLDRNFHVYIHGDTNLIEKGVDPDGRKYYKIYFDREE